MANIGNLFATIGLDGSSFIGGLGKIGAALADAVNKQEKFLKDYEKQVVDAFKNVEAAAAKGDRAAAARMKSYQAITDQIKTAGMSKNQKETFNLKQMGASGTELKVFEDWQKQRDKAAKAEENLQKRQEYSAVTMGRLGIAAVAAATAVGAFVVHQVRAIEAAKNSADAIGISVESYTGLQFAAEKANLGVGQFDGAMRMLNRTVGMAAEGNADAGRKFEVIGVSIRDVNGQIKPTDVLLKELATKFQAMPAGVDKTTAAMDFFGRELGTKMIPFLNEGGAGLDEMQGKAKALGRVVSEETATKIQDLNANIGSLTGVLQGMANTALAQVAPAAADMTGAMVKFAEETNIAKEAGDALALVLRALASVAVGAGATFQLAGKAIGGTAAVWSLRVQGEFEAAAAASKELDKDMEKDLMSTSKLLNGIWGEGAGQPKQKIGKEGAAGATKTGSGYVADSKALALRDAAAKAAAASAKKLAEEIERTVTSLENEAEAFGITTEYAKLYELMQKGASDADITRARAALEKLDGLKLTKEIYEQSLTPMDEYTKRVRELTSALQNGGISQDTFTKGLQQANEKVQAYKDQQAQGVLGKRLSTADLGSAAGQMSELDVLTLKIQAYNDEIARQKESLKELSDEAWRKQQAAITANELSVAGLNQQVEKYKENMMMLETNKALSGIDQGVTSRTIGRGQAVAGRQQAYQKQEAYYQQESTTQVPGTSAWLETQDKIAGVRKELAALGEESRKVNGTAATGFKDAVWDMVDKQKTAYETMYEATVKVADAMQTALSDGFFKLMEGDFNSLEDVARGFKSAINKIVADILSELAMAWVKTNLLKGMLGQGGGTGTSGVMGGNGTPGGGGGGIGSWLGSLFGGGGGNAAAGATDYMGYASGYNPMGIQGSSSFVGPMQQTATTASSGFGSGVTAGGVGAAWGLGSMFGSWLASRKNRAIGGPVAPKQPYRVGEHGPETFVPQGMGRIEPNATTNPAQVNVKNVNVLDPSLIGQYLATDAGEKLIMNTVQRNQRQLGIT